MASSTSGDRRSGRLVAASAIAVGQVRPGAGASSTAVEPQPRGQVGRRAAPAARRSSSPPPGADVDHVEPVAGGPSASSTRATSAQQRGGEQRRRRARWCGSGRPGRSPADEEAVRAVERLGHRVAPRHRLPPSASTPSPRRRRHIVGAMACGERSHIRWLHRCSTGTYLRSTGTPHRGLDRRMSALPRPAVPAEQPWPNSAVPGRVPDHRRHRRRPGRRRARRRARRAPATASSPPPAVSAASLPGIGSPAAPAPRCCPPTRSPRRGRPAAARRTRRRARRRRRAAWPSRGRPRRARSSRTPPARTGSRVLAPAVAAGARPLALHPAMTFTGTPDDLDRLRRHLVRRDRAGRPAAARRPGWSPTSAARRSGSPRRAGRSTTRRWRTARTTWSRSSTRRWTGCATPA